MATSLQLLQLEGDPFSEEDLHLRNAATAQAVVQDREHRMERTFALALEQPVVLENLANVRDVRLLRPSLPLLGNTISPPEVVPDPSNTRVRRRYATNGRSQKPVATGDACKFLYDSKAAVAHPKYEEPDPVLLSERPILRTRFRTTTILGTETMKT